MNIQMIPLNRLVPSPFNVRKTGGMAIDDLAASITAHGLLQNLQVRPTAKGKFEVVAGGRRLKALNLLAKNKCITKSFEVGCNVMDGDNLTEISLAENTLREAMHPADQFDAFQKLATEGMSVDDIAARFGCGSSTVKQRLKLANVHPDLIQLYREDDITLEHVMAFTVCDDQTAQLECWQSLPEWNRKARTIRDTLMAEHVDGDDTRVRFVGMDAYVAAGGPVLRDLFDDEHQGYLTDIALLDRLVADKLEREAEAVRAEGWKWVEIQPVYDPNAFSAFEEIPGTETPFADEEVAELQRIEIEFDALTREDDGSDETSDRIDALHDRREELTNRPYVWTAEEMADSGAILSLASSGELYIHKGLVPLSETSRPVKKEAKPKGASTPKGLSAKLIEELTAHKTAALQVTMAEHVPATIIALTQALAAQIFYGVEDTAFHIHARRKSVDGHGETLKESEAVEQFDALMADWKERLPENADSLIAWLERQSMQTCLNLLAVCAASTLDAVQMPSTSPSNGRLTSANDLASWMKLDMTDWWEPTAANYLNRVSKSFVLDAVAEARSRQAAKNIAGLKKDKLVADAEKILARTGWLPPLLRTT